MAETNKINYLSLLEEKINKINQQKPGKQELQEIEFLAEKVCSRKDIDDDSIKKLEGVLETLGKSWEGISTSRTIARTLEEYYQKRACEDILDNEDDDKYMISLCAAAYWIAKAAATRKKYLSGEQMQK